MRLQHTGSVIDHTRFGLLTPELILLEFDGPRIFTARDNAGQSLLVYQCADDDSGANYIVVPSSEAMIKDLGAGRITISTALHQTWAWIVTTDNGGIVTGAFTLATQTLPDWALPNPSATLYPQHMPLLTVRLRGSRLHFGLVTAGIVKIAAEKSLKALNALTQGVLERNPTVGRPADSLRRYYDLPVQRLGFGSFEISLGRPALPSQLATDGPNDHDVLNAAKNLLNEGLSWTTTQLGKSAAVIDFPSVELVPALTAIYELSPPHHGTIESVEISGTLIDISGKPYTLTRESTKHVRAALNQVTTPRSLVDVDGDIREFDKDKFSFILRNVADGPERRCLFDEGLFDVALAAFDSDQRVKVIGYLNANGDVDVVAIQPTDTSVRMPVDL